MTYSKQTWAPGKAGGTPLSADRMNHIEDGIAAAGQDASTTAKGVVQLVGALGGQAGSPTALGLASQSALAEFVADTVAALLLEGSNITLTYDDAKGALTVAAANPSLSTIPGALALVAPQNADGSWTRPSSRTDLRCLFLKTVTGSQDPAKVTSPATNGAYVGDLLFRGVA